MGTNAVSVDVPSHPFLLPASSGCSHWQVWYHIDGARLTFQPLNRPILRFLVSYVGPSSLMVSPLYEEFPCHTGREHSGASSHTESSFSR